MQVDLGFYDAPGGRRHRETFTGFERALHAVIRDYSRALGKPLPKKMLALALGMFPAHITRPVDIPASAWEKVQRELGEAVLHLVDYHGVAILGMAGVKGGYYLPESDLEGQGLMRPQWARAVTSMRRALKLSKYLGPDLPQAMVQLVLDLGEDEQAQVIKYLKEEMPKGLRTGGHAELVALLERYQRNPQEYGRQIEELQERFQGLFVKRSVLDEAVEALERARQAVNRARGQAAA